MKKTLLASVTISDPCWPGATPSDNDSQPPPPRTQAHEYLVQLSSSAEGHRRRPTGTEAETRAAAWIQDHLTGWGYVGAEPALHLHPERQPEALPERRRRAQGPESDKVILIGAHHDSTGGEGLGRCHRQRRRRRGPAGGRRGAQGSRPCPARCASSFGAEENGLNGSRALLPPASMAPPSPSCWPW